MTAPAPSTHAAPPVAAGGRKGIAALAAVWIASAAVIAASTLASFRLDFAADPATLSRVNGPRALLGAGVGGALALAGALRLVLGLDRRLRELEILALSAGAAGGGFIAAQGHAGIAALVAFTAGAFAGASVSFGLVRALDRPKRWTNLAAAILLAALIGVAALAGTYARARRDFVAPSVDWLLGSLAGASFASGGVLLGLSAALLGFAFHALRADSRSQLTTLSLLAFGIGVGAAGPLVFVGALAPRCVRWLARGASPRALLPACVAAGAATVVAIDAVPRLLVGGYDFPFNVPAALLAVPVFLGWNREQLRSLAGPASRGFEIFEIILIAGMTLAGTALAVTLAIVIAFAT